MAATPFAMFTEFIVNIPFIFICLMKIDFITSISSYYITYIKEVNERGTGIHTIMCVYVGVVVGGGLFTLVSVNNKLCMLHLCTKEKQTSGLFLYTQLHHYFLFTVCLSVLSSRFLFDLSLPPLSLFFVVL